MSLVQILDRLQTHFGVYETKPRGLGPGQSGREAILHEFCHLVTLHAELGDHDLRRGHIVRPVETLCSKLDPMARDWNEIASLACEVHVLRRIGILRDADAFLKQQARTVRWGHFTRPLSLLHANAKARSACDNATRVTAALREMAKRLREMELEHAPG